MLRSFQYILPKLFVIATLALSVTFGFHTLQAVSAAKPDGRTAQTAAQAAKVRTIDYDTLREKLQDIVDRQGNLSVSVALYDLDSNRQVNAGVSDAFTAASTTKVLTAVYFLRQVELGNAELDQDIDGESAQSLMQKMIQNSDNDAWHDLNEFLGEANKQGYAEAIGLSSYDADANTITASDEALLLRKLYGGKLINATHRSLLLSYMQHTNDEDLIPVALPSTATIYHKYGYLYGELHDAGIVTYKGHTFVLVIFTDNADETELDDYGSRTTLFHDLTNEVVQAYDSM